MKSVSLRIWSVVAVSLALSVIFIRLGFFLAANKPLWTDEFYTQHSSIDQKSYSEILAGRIMEGNACPLFYLIQKMISDAASYKLEAAFEGLSHISEPRGQQVLRISPVIFMSLSLVLIFWYFTRWFSWGAGWYALLVSLSARMVWLYWAEARPYAQWFFLTTWQTLYLIDVAGQNRLRKKDIWFFGLINLALALTITFGTLQVLCASALLWLWVERDWKKCFLPAVLPFMGSLFYYFRAPRFGYWFALPPWRLIIDNFPLEHGVLIFCYGGFVLFLFLKSRGRFGLEPDQRQGLVVLSYTAAMLLIAVGVLGLFIFKDTGEARGFGIPSRFLLYLSSISIIVVSFLAVNLFRGLRNYPWLRFNFVLLCGGLLIMRLLKMVSEVLSNGIY